MQMHLPSVHVTTILRMQQLLMQRKVRDSSYIVLELHHVKLYLNLVSRGVV